MITYAVKYVPSKNDVACHHDVTRYQQRQRETNVLVENVDQNSIRAFIAVLLGQLMQLSPSDQFCHAP